jgi:hypothetical protein
VHSSLKVCELLWFFKAVLLSSFSLFLVSGLGVFVKLLSLAINVDFLI